MSTAVHRGMSLYVHVPFCETKCPYCDFNTYAGIEVLVPGYINALKHELLQWGKLLDHHCLATVFFGGGTPSYLPTRDLAGLIAQITNSFDLAPDAEVSLEANPGDLTRERAHAVRRAGFNRLSIGVQSMDDGELRMLGRRHTAEQATRAVAAARQAGFDNLSIDLMFGLPRQSFESWAHTLDETLALRPDHMSLYALTLEIGTPMEAQVRLGMLQEPDPDLAAAMYRHAQSELAQAGYEQYEISNWALPGRHSRHNLTYWQGGSYLGVGPGAHSYLMPNGAAVLGGVGLHGTRFAVASSPRSYVARARAWEPGCHNITSDFLRSVAFIEQVELLDERTAMTEAMMLGLRLNSGVTRDSFLCRFQRDIETAFPEATAECVELGLLEWEAGSLRLKESARLLANEVFRRFLI